MNDLPSRIRAAALVAVLALTIAGCAPASSAAGSAPATPRTTEVAQIVRPSVAPTVAPASTTGKPEAIRIEFERGGTDAYVEGKLAANEVRSYVLWAKEGQQMDVDVDSPKENVNLTVSAAPDSKPLARPAGSATRWNGDLPASQDYILNLVGPAEPTTYALIASIPARVQFPAGATSTAVRGKTQSVTTYIVSARAGQSLSVKVTSPNSDVVLSIHGITDGVPFITTMTDATSWSGSVVATQDYALSLVATTGPSDYELSVSLQ